MSAFSLRARWIVPVDGPPIEGGCVTVEGRRIVAVGGPHLAAGPVDDLGDVALLPGLVNAHCHLEFSNLSRPVGERSCPLTAWIERVIAERKRAHRNATAAVAAGLIESLRAGVTTIGEIATSQASVYQVDGPRPRLALLHEAIGFSAARCDSTYADVTRRAESASPDGETILASGVSPHAPYTVHPELVTRLGEWARRRQAPIAMHLAESPQELELLGSGAGPFRELLESRSMWDPGAVPAGTRPVEFLRRLAAAPRALAIHGNYFGAEELDYLAAHREQMSVVYCPRTHGFFDHEPYPLDDMLAAGARVALGTDSRASNPDLGLWNEVRAALASHPRLSPAAAMEMATIRAAEALGVEGHVGSLTPGKFADVIAIPCAAGAADVQEAVVQAEPTLVCLGGERVPCY